MRLVDTHCHLDFDAYRDDLDDVLERAWEAGVERILIPGIDLESSRNALRLAEQHHRIYAAVGIHPNSAQTWEAGSVRRMEALIEHPKVVAIGEIGLDYYRDRAPHGLQAEVLGHQLEMAQRANLPVILHVRNADNKDRSCIIDLLEILAAWKENAQESYPASRFGVLHSFSGNVEEARRSIDLGFKLGVTGPVTYQNAHTLHQVVTSSPVACLLIETDGPFLTPNPNRGKRNEPAYVRYVAEKIANLKGLSADEVASKTTENAQRLFAWR